MPPDLITCEIGQCLRKALFQEDVQPPRVPVGQCPSRVPSPNNGTTTIYIFKVRGQNSEFTHVRHQDTSLPSINMTTPAHRNLRSGGSSI